MKRKWWIRLRGGAAKRFALGDPSVVLVLKVAAACAITAAVAGSLDWSRVEAAWRGLRITQLVWAALAIVMAQGLIGLRWAWLASQVAGTPAGRAFRDAIVATLFSLVTPAGVGGDVYRVAASPTGPGSRMRTGTIVMTERLLGIFVYALIFLACFTLLVGRQGGFLASLAPWLLAISIAALMLGVAGRRLLAGVLARFAGARMAALASALDQIKAGSAVVWAVAFLASLGATLTWIAAAALLSDGLAVRPPFAGIAATAVIAELSRILPISVQGVGVREAAFGLGFADLGAPFDDGVFVGAVLYLMHAAIVVITGLLALGARRAPPAVSPSSWPLGVRRSGR